MKALAAIRVQKIKSMSTIRAAEAHGRRLDEASSRRVDASRTALNLAASQYSPDDPLALEAAYRGFRKATGAVEGKGAAIMAHMIAVISPEVLAETGDPRDPNNPKVRALFEQAQAWARSEFGDESLVASRLDVDEAGAGVVDLFVCPTAMQAGGRGRKPKLTISVKSGLEAVAAKNGNKRSYSAIQDSWGEWASQHIDRRLKRGKPKRETMLKHVHADILREEYEAIDRRKAELDARESALMQREEAIKRQISEEKDIMLSVLSGQIVDIYEPARSQLEARPKRDVQIKTAKGVGSGLLSHHYPAVRPDFERVLLGVFEQRRRDKQLLKRAKTAVEAGIQAFLLGEITDVREDAESEPKRKRYSYIIAPEMTQQRRKELRHNVVGFPFVAEILHLMKSVFDRLGVKPNQRHEYAKERGLNAFDDLDSGPSFGPTFGP